MNNIAINQAETIFEPFWDTGESFVGHQKYSRLTPYKIIIDENAKAVVKDSWCGVTMEILKAGTGTWDVVLERNCNLDISDYDLMTVFAIVPKNIKFEIEYIAEEKSRTAISVTGTGYLEKYYGKIEGSSISTIRIKMSGPAGCGTVSLYWMGLAKSKMLDCLEPKSTFSEEWEGCFEDCNEENFVAQPECNIFFDKEELIQLREKLKKEPFLSKYIKLKEEAQKFLHSKPEKAISTYFPMYCGQFGNYYGDGKVECELCQGMILLGFVGVVENDFSMLKMAARMALSAANCRYWCENFMGQFPGVTWHHRSFIEYRICYACALVLDWAGSLLTWHGKNVIYDAIIMKGLPRIEADFKTMDYIYECNQAFMFNTGRVAAYIALSKRYPRFQKEIDAAEQDMFEMVDRTIEEDGGSIEGATYWGATLKTAFPTMFMLAKYRGIAIDEYVPDKVKVTVDYGLALMSDYGKNYRFVPISDTSQVHYSYTSRGIVYLVAMCAMISKSELWKDIYHTLVATSADEDINYFDDTNFLLMAQDCEKAAGTVSKDGFWTFNYVGTTALRRTTAEGGSVRLVICGGKTSKTHSHGDKGSIVLEVNGTPIIVDPGIGLYESADASRLAKAEYHNLLLPEKQDGTAYNQPKNVYGGRIRKAEFKDGMLNYSVNLTDAWEKGVFTRYIRNIKSDNACAYEIEDFVDFTERTRASFCLHTYAEIENHGSYFSINEEAFQVNIYPINYTPESVEVLGVGLGGLWNGTMENKVYQPLKRLKINLPMCKEGKFIHRIEVKMSLCSTIASS